MLDGKEHRTKQMLSIISKPQLKIYLVSFLSSVSLSAFAQASYKEAKGIFAPSEQNYCFDGPYKAKSKDKWLALVEVNGKWELQEAIVKAGVVIEKKGVAHFFMKPKAKFLAPGSVTSADIVQLTAKNALFSEAKFSFTNTTWRWVEWGNFAFYLQQGDKRWVVEDSSWPWENLVIVPGKLNVPANIRSSNQKHRDDYDVGSHILLWAGDLNNDGLLDIITRRQVKESWGTML